MLMRTSGLTYAVCTACLYLLSVNFATAQITPFKFEEGNNGLYRLSDKNSITKNIKATIYWEEFKKSNLVKDSSNSNKYYAEYNEFVYDKIKEKVETNYKNELNKLNADPKKTPAELREGTRELNDKLRDTLKEIKGYLYYSHELRYLSYKNDFKFFPARNFTQAQLFYNSYVSDKKYQFAENTNFIFNTQGQRITGMTELYADYYGPFRVSFGALISNKGTGVYYDSTGVAMVDSAGIQLDATQRFLGGGGNAIIQVSLPFFNYTHPNDQFHFKGMISPKYSFDVPSLGTFLDNPTANLDLGLDLSVFFTGALNTLTFYAFNRSSYTDGTSLFYSNLNLKERKGFFSNQLTLGMAIKSIFRLSYSIYFVTDENLRPVFKPMVGFSIIPQ